MATDPYHAVQAEIQTSLQTASQLRASYVRIRNMAVREDSEELIWARNELKATLAALEADLEDLEESVKIVEQTGPRMFGLEEHEVQERRRYVERVRGEVESMRAEVSGQPQPQSQPASLSRTSSFLGDIRGSQPGTPRPGTPHYRDGNGGGGHGGGEDDDDQSAWAREEQQMMIRDQDRTIDSIAGTLSTLAQQAGLMGQEIGEHNELLTDLESGVDRSSSRLSDAMQRMRKFARETEQKGSGWCIVILVIVLMVLLVVVILV